MSRFKQITEPRDDPELAALYQDLVASGMSKDGPLNWFTSQSERPDLLQATWSLTKAILLQGRLPSTLKQMIVLKVSTQNDCRYCRVLHTDALRAMGVPPEVVDNITTDVSLAKLPPSQRAIVHFAVKVARDPQSVTDEDFLSLEQHGLNRGEIMEVVMMAAYSNFVNTWADVSGISIEA